MQLPHYQALTKKLRIAYKIKRLNKLGLLTKTKKVMKVKKCYNCKHSSDQFKVLKLTHLHCLKPEHDKLAKEGNISPWDTLRVFSDTCNDHEFKTKNKN